MLEVKKRKFNQMSTLSKSITITKVLLLQLIIVYSFMNILEPLYGKNADKDALPFIIVDIEYQKKGGAIKPFTKPKYILYVVKAVLKEYTSNITENDVNKTLQAILQKVREDARQHREQIDGVSAFLYISKENIDAGSMALGRIEWWPKGHSFEPNNVFNVGNKTTYVEKIDIYSLPKTDLNQNESQITKNIIGTWIDTYGIPHTVIIRKSRSNYIMKKQFGDGSSSEKVLFIKKVNNEKRLYEDPDNYFGDYMVIKKDGSLEFYDIEGFIYSLSPVNGR